MSKKMLKLFIFIIFVTALGNCGADPIPDRPYRNSDICGRYNNHRVYLERNEKGILHASNVVFNATSEPLNGINLPRECNLELVTCPACVIRVSLIVSNFRNSCNSDDDHILVTEPPYDPTISGKRLCGSDIAFRSQTRSVNIRFIYRGNYSLAFTLEYYAERNRITVTSNPSETVYLAGLYNKSIASPFFPTYYPRDLAVETLLTCMSESCRVHVIFTDFQISPSSLMEFVDMNGEKLEIITGLVSRPKPIISKTNSMVVRFFANGGTGIGYKAEVKFLTEAAANDNALKPITDCGGLVDTFGGAITMMRMLTNETEPLLFDCVWIIRPPNSYLHLKTHLMMRVDAFESMAGVSELVIKQGVTSNSPELERITYPNGNRNATAWIIPITTGFYISLKGIFGQDSRLAIVYSVYSYMNCFIGSEFLCGNHRCIPIQLHCDGFDHCGDKSDEPESCSTEWESEPINRRWYVHTPNYYFPKIDSYPDLKAATMVFLMSSIGLLTLISCLIILLHKTAARTREQRELQCQLQTISELLDSNNHRNDEPIDEPPTYEAPPEYEDVIKLGLDAEKKHRSRSSGRKSRLQRPRHEILEVVLPPENSVSPTSSEAENNQNIVMLREQLENSQFFNAAQRIDFTTLRAPLAETSEASSSEQGIIPESPPPAYVSSTIYFSQPIKSDSDISTTSERPNGYSDSALNVQLSLSMTPVNQSIESVPQHLWSDNTRNNKHWHFASVSQSSSFDSVTQAQIQEINAYFLTYGASAGTGINSRCASCSSYSSASSSSSLLTESKGTCCSHSSSSDYIVSSHQESLTHGFRMCSTCGGKLSFQELRNAANLTVSQIVTTTTTSATTSGTGGTTEIRLCNCFPSTSGGSQHSIFVTATSSNALPSNNRAVSEDITQSYQPEIIEMPREQSVDLNTDVDYIEADNGNQNDA